jgi:hypothetical protein
MRREECAAFTLAYPPPPLLVSMLVLTKRNNKIRIVMKSEIDQQRGSPSPELSPRQAMGLYLYAIPTEGIPSSYLWMGVNAKFPELTCDRHMSLLILMQEVKWLEVRNHYVTLTAKGLELRKLIENAMEKNEKGE